jgi:hypothetical protein
MVFSSANSTVSRDVHLMIDNLPGDVGRLERDIRDVHSSIDKLKRDGGRVERDISLLQHLNVR